ncbi:GTP pyrophosphokinase [Burkholderia cenocepacia]|nr:GTP pyrophosphokinase [Burkholderia cenocepacia]MBR8324495.1 GTP pyrophosphokinase [Burkholderia cenocepacia]
MTEERIVAVLHDVIEDTEWTLDRLHAEGFSESVLNGLDAVTRRPGENYDDFVRRASRDVIGLNVKLEDLRDNANLSRISRPTDVDRKRIEKYQRAIAWLTLTRNEAGRLVEQRS